MIRAARSPLGAAGQKAGVVAHRYAVLGSNPAWFLTRPPLTNKKGSLMLPFCLYGGEGGIRTHGASRLNGFQDRRFRPLSHLSG